jgi:hypothetical protein
MLANWVLASHHSRGGIFHFPATCIDDFIKNAGLEASARRGGAGLRLDGICMEDW